jgi:hypothetical protein
LGDVGVDEVSDQLGLADEVLDEHLLAGEMLADDFHGDAFDEGAGAMLFGFVDDAHATFEDFPCDFVTELTLDGEQRIHVSML